MKNMKKIFVLLCIVLSLSLGFAVAEGVTYRNGSFDGSAGDVKVTVTTSKEDGIVNIQINGVEKVEKGVQKMLNTILETNSLAEESFEELDDNAKAVLAAIANALKEGAMSASEMGYEYPAPEEGIEETGADKEGWRNFDYTTQGSTCSTKITFKVKEDDMTVHDIVVVKGCDGNARGFSALADGSEVDDIIKRFSGITCHASDGSSCPDQVAKALNEARFIITGERLELE